MITRLGLVLVLVTAACGDNDKGRTDSGTGSDSGPPATLTAFVIDLITNQTANNTEPVPYATFSTLPDPDGSNSAAYASLF